MKKLMMAVAIVCAAVAAQAAQVTWNSNGVKFVDASGNPTTLDSGTAICLIVLSDNTGWTSGEWTAAKDSVTELATATLGTGKTAGNIVGTTFNFEYGTSAQKFADGAVLAVVFKDSTGAYNQLVYKNDVTAAVTETLTVSGLADDQNLWSKELKFAQNSSLKAGGIMAQSIPEPTSAMLLLLGVAGLALRRRRA